MTEEQGKKDEFLMEFASYMSAKLAKDEADAASAILFDRAVDELTAKARKWWQLARAGGGDGSAVIELPATTAYLESMEAFEGIEKVLEKGLSGGTQIDVVNSGPYRETRTKKPGDSKRSALPPVYGMVSSVFRAANLSVYTDRSDASVTVDQFTGCAQQPLHGDSIDMVHAFGNAAVGDLMSPSRPNRATAAQVCACAATPDSHGMGGYEDCHFSLFIAVGQDQALDIGMHNGLGGTMAMGRLLLKVNMAYLVPSSTFHRGTEFIGIFPRDVTVKLFGEVTPCNAHRRGVRLMPMSSDSQVYADLAGDSNIVTGYTLSKVVRVLREPLEALSAHELKLQPGMQDLIVL